MYYNDLLKLVSPEIVANSQFTRAYNPRIVGFNHGMLLIHHYRAPTTEPDSGFRRLSDSRGSVADELFRLIQPHFPDRRPCHYD